jgi:hypothetical protein
MARAVLMASAILTASFILPPIYFDWWDISQCFPFCLENTYIAIFGRAVLNARLKGQIWGTEVKAD